MVDGVALGILYAALILASAYLASILFRKLIIGVVWKRNRSVAFEISRVGALAIWTAGVLFTLPVLGASELVVSVVILLAGAFLILATRDFTGNWFAGQLIKTIAPYRVGDWVRMSGAYGRVARIDNLYTTLVTKENETVVIPNSMVTSDLIVDRTTNGSVKVPVELEVDPGRDFSEALTAIRDVSVEISSTFADLGEVKEPEIDVVSSSAQVMRIRVVLEIANPAREQEVVSEFIKRCSGLGISKSIGPRS